MDEERIRPQRAKKNTKKYCRGRENKPHDYDFAGIHHYNFASIHGALGTYECFFCGKKEIISLEDVII